MRLVGIEARLDRGDLRLDAGPVGGVVDEPGRLVERLPRAGHRRAGILALSDALPKVVAFAVEERALVRVAGIAPDKSRADALHDLVAGEIRVVHGLPWDSFSVFGDPALPIPH